MGGHLKGQRTPRKISNGVLVGVLVLLVIAIFIFAGCGISPVRVFQAKVPPPILKSEQQVEAERQAADVLVRGLNGVRHLEELAVWLEVARKLSISLGAPEKPISIDQEKPKVAVDRAVVGLDTGITELQKKIAAQNVVLAKYAGKEIEGTGFSLLGPGMTVVIIGLIVLAVACPPVLTLLFFAFKRLKAATGIVVEQIEQASEEPETKAAVATIKKNIGSVMDHLPTKQGILSRQVIKDLKTA